MAYSPVKPCKDCGRPYNQIALAACPECSVEDGSGLTRRTSRQTSTYTESSEDLLKQVLLGVNRTTYAVRAVVSLTAILIITSGIVFLLQLLTAAIATTDNDTLVGFLNFLSFVGAIVGIYLAYSQFFSEWRKSKVPDRY
jgi:hypothetical protein